MPSRTLLLTGTFVALALGAFSCAVVGNVRPVDEKSDQYGVMDLSATNPDWIRLNPAKTTSGQDQSLSSTEIPDVAYQSRSLASIISVDSACRPAGEMQGEDLRTLTNLLFLGLTDVTLRDERNLEIQRSPALETTLVGSLNGQPMEFRTVVLRRRDCVYDLIYMSRPGHFARHEQDFSHFVASLKLKE